MKASRVSLVGVLRQLSSETACVNEGNLTTIQIMCVYVCHASLRHTKGTGVAKISTQASQGPFAFLA